MEKELSTDLWVVLTPSPGFEEDIQVFEITSPSGHKYEFPKYDHGIVYFHFEAQNNEAGVWSFKAIMHPIVTQTVGSMVSLEVFGQQSTSGNAVTLDFWSAPSSDALTKILYARVSQDGLPIQNANVLVFVYPPTRRTEHYSRPLKLKLGDEGTGYPDITAGDGIYSAYLTLPANEYSSDDYYSVVLKTDYNNGMAYLPKPYGNEKNFHCCGSKLPEYYTIPTSPFERVFAGRSLKNAKINHGQSKKKDYFPPSRITNLRLEGYFNETLKAKLSWTAPGDDFNQGTAFRYQMRCYTHPQMLSSKDSSHFLNKAIPVHESLLPSPEISGTRQSVTVSLPWANEVFYYAITTLDESNNRGQVSNLAPVYIEELKTTTQLEMSFRVVNMTHNSVTSKFEQGLDNDTMIYVISGCITAFLLVLITLLTICIYRNKRRRALKQRPPPPITGNEHSEPNIYVVNSNADQPLSSVTTTTSVLPDVATSGNNNENKSATFDLWKMDTLMDSGYINTYFRGSGMNNVSAGGGSNLGNGNYTSLQAFPHSTGLGPMSLLSLNISQNPKATGGANLMTTSHSQTNLSALTSSQLPLQVFRYIKISLIRIPITDIMNLSCNSKTMTQNQMTIFG